jgi:8-oxo-dGTP pyrophosphatase MutT (NUDIX family)
MRTVKEISSGGVVYRKNRGVVEVALIRVRNRWGLPKGQVEEDEGLQETALREVLEETGLEGKIVAKLGDITYWYTNKTKDGETIRIFKRVYFHLIRYLRGDISRHDQEVEEACWFPLTEARRQISYSAERDILNKAKIFLDGEISNKAPRTRRAGGG